MIGSHRILSGILLFATALAALSCGAPANRPAGNSETTGPGGRGGEIRYRTSTAPSTFNYLLAADEATVVTALYFLTSRLVEFDHAEQKFVPGLAESWTVGADGRTVDVKLRDGLKFSDGDTLDADDVIFTLTALYDKRTQSPAFRDAMLVDDAEIASKKVDALHLQLIFPRPVASVENYFVNLGVLPSHVLKADADAGKLAGSWKLDSPLDKIVSSGPFVVSAVTPGERIEFARNPNYWKKDEKGTQLPYIDKLTVEVIPDPNNVLARLEQGTLDIVDRIRPSDYAQLSRSAGNIRPTDAGPGLGIDHIWFNLNPADPAGKPLANEVKRSWFENRSFRRAVAAAVDRETIASVTLQGLASPLYGFVSPANKQWIDNSLGKIAYDLGAAEQMLREAGFQKQGSADSPQLVDPRGNPVEFSLIVPTGNEPRIMSAAVIQQDLAKLGMKMTVVPVEFAALTERWTKSYDYDAILLGLSQTDYEPSSYQGFLVSSAAIHQWRPTQKTPATEWEAQIDRLFAEQAAERDPAKRKEIFSQIQKIMREQMPVIPIVARHVASAASTKIGNYKPSPILPYSMWNVEALYVKP